MKFRIVVPALLMLVVVTVAAEAGPLVYVVTSQQQFGVVDLSTGAFREIGPTTPEGQSNLVWGRDGRLYSLTYSGNLETIDPRTGIASVVGATGLGFNAFDLAAVGGKLYATDFSNNLYSVDATTGAAQPIGVTGIPPELAIPFSVNADGTVNLCDETLYGVDGRLYATFDAFTIDPVTLKMVATVRPRVYEIDPSTGVAQEIAPTALNLSASVETAGGFYAFHLVPTGFSPFGPVSVSEVVRLDLDNGHTRLVATVDPAAGAIFGAAPVRRPGVNGR
jgi:hypothetical protein